MRIETSGNYDWRQDLYEQQKEALDEGTKVGGIDTAAELVLELLGKPGVPGDGALQKVAKFLEDDRVPDDVALELAEALSVGPVELKVATRSVDVVKDGGAK